MKSGRFDPVGDERMVAVVLEAAVRAGAPHAEIDAILAMSAEEPTMVSARRSWPHGLAGSLAAIDRHGRPRRIRPWRSARPVLVVRARQVRIPGIDRTERVCLGPGAIRSPGVQTSSGLNCQREPPRPAITS